MAWGRPVMRKIITVSREFGSGGRELGKRLADELGVDYYDREIVLALAEKTGIDEHFLENQLEKGGLVNYPVHYAQTFTQFPAVSDMTVQLLNMQQKLLRELAARGDCVIVGRAADSILEEYRPFRIFVYASPEAKVARCRSRSHEDEDLSDREILRQMKRIDKARAEYHDIISPNAWGNKTSYHLCVNTTGIDIKSVIPALAEYCRHYNP